MTYLKTHKPLKPIYICLMLLCCGLWTCKPTAKEEEEKKPNTVTPVHITHIETGPLTDYIELNATSSFLKKQIIKSIANGYITNIAVNIGDRVSEGNILFTIKTKEASAMKDLHDTTLNFSGVIKIKASKSGVISMINHQLGDYVQDGEQLCMISEQSSFVFLMDVPFEIHKYAKPGVVCDIVLPGKDIIKGTIKSGLSAMDVGSQTQSYVVQPATDNLLPENLIAKVRIAKERKGDAVTLPKSAILSDEIQTSFWIMKLINDSVAVKVPVKKGIETSERTEILSPKLGTKDRILSSGNYALPDTAKVSVQKEPE